MSRILLLTIILLSISIYFEKGYCNSMIDFSKKYIVKSTLPESKMDDRKLSEYMTQLFKNSVYLKDGVINRVIIDNEWRIQRNEFTGITTSRYVKASFVVSEKNKSEYMFVIPCTFIQKLKFFGFIEDGMRLRMVHKSEIYKVKRN